MTTNKKKISWEVEFSEEFDELWNMEDKNGHIRMVVALKFISTLLSEQKKELKEKIEKLYDDKDTNDMTLDKVMEKLI